MKKNRFFIRGETRVCDGIKQHSAVDLRYVQARSRTNWWTEAGKDKIVKQLAETSTRNRNYRVQGLRQRSLISESKKRLHEVNLRPEKGLLKQ